jgi:hypothetical protein
LSCTRFSFLFTDAVDTTNGGHAREYRTPCGAEHPRAADALTNLGALLDERGGPRRQLDGLHVGTASGV